MPMESIKRKKYIHWERIGKNQISDWSTRHVVTALANQICAPAKTWEKHGNIGAGVVNVISGSVG